MKTVIQRVDQASITVAGACIAEIGCGILAFIGIEKNDTLETAERLLDKILHYRIFENHKRQMNISLFDKSASLLLVPQLTSVADTHKGLRPSFSNGADPAKAKDLFTQMLALAKTKYHSIAAGQFGADMKISLCNNGPVTFILREKLRLL